MHEAREVPGREREREAEPGEVLQDQQPAAPAGGRVERRGEEGERSEEQWQGEVIARDALVSRDKVKKRESQFRFPTSISFDNEGSDIYTMIEVDTRDRPGLLFDLARTLANANIYISSAQIATYGAQVVDTFYVKDMFGLKIHGKSKQRSIEAKLREAIEHGSKRAKS